MKKVLLVCDRPNWAYDSIAQALIKYNDRNDLVLETFYIKGGDKNLKSIKNNYDLIFVLGWQLLITTGLFGIQRRNRAFEFNKTISGIHSHHAWDDRMTMPDNSPHPPEKLIEFLKKYKGINAVSERLYKLFKQTGLDNVVYTPNGVDTELFKPMKPLCEKENLIVGYSGSLKHDWRKGITEYIEPACKKAGVELKKAMAADGHYVPIDRMPEFYNEIDVYLCASSSEGFSLSVLEASACGRPVISTCVGGCEDLIIDGENGFIVDRDVDSITEKILVFKEDRKLVKKMGSANRRMVKEKWSWKLRARNWLDFINNGLEKTYGRN
jgi:glycosyltransferase involved in cell wall biosynthesis